jgi:hypothetical protein
MCLETVAIRITCHAVATHSNPPTHSPTHPPTHPPTHSPTHPPIHPPTHSLTHPLTKTQSRLSLTNALISPTRTPAPTHSHTNIPTSPTNTHAPTHPLTHPPTYTPHPPTRPPAHTHSPTYVPTLPTNTHAHQPARTHAQVALKKIMIRRIEDGVPKNALREIKALQEIDVHDNIVTLRSVFSHGNGFVLVFDYMHVVPHPFPFDSIVRPSLFPSCTCTLCLTPSHLTPSYALPSFHHAHARCASPLSPIAHLLSFHHVHTRWCRCGVSSPSRHMEVSWLCCAIPVLHHVHSVLFCCVISLVTTCRLSRSLSCMVYHPHSVSVCSMQCAFTSAHKTAARTHRIVSYTHPSIPLPFSTTPFLNHASFSTTPFLNHASFSTTPFDSQALGPVASHHQSRFDWRADQVVHGDAPSRGRVLSRQPHHAP